MASSNDIRDIMNLGHAGPRQPAPKKKRHGEHQVRMTGFKREVQALMGDSVPPIAIVEQRSYKSRPSISQRLFKPRHWEERPFQHGARTDGLVLRHWKRSIPGSNVHARAVANLNEAADVEMTDAGAKASAVPAELRFEDEFPSEKWNVKVQVPSYTDEQYEANFKSEEWTKEETDYLLDLCREYDLRWIIIADRYDPQDIPSPKPPASAPDGATNGGTEVVRQYPVRTMEALKARYYSIAAKTLETHTPASNMTQAEFQLWEKMRNFDAKTETLRKNMAEKLFERTKDEADEERILLEELHRITKNEDDFIKMRRDLYARLEPVPVIRRTENGQEQPTAIYQTSSGLSMLLQTLLAKEKRLKRPPMPNGAEVGAASANSADAQKWEKGRHPNQYTRREHGDSQAEEPGPQKKGSTSQPNVRVLTPAEEAKFGVSHPQERLTSGVQFRHEKINRLTMAKSQVQTSKIQAALTELGIPPRLLMPTERVCREFERLVGEINVLLDCRKVNEKIASEIKILEEHRRIRLGLPKDSEEASGSAPAPAPAPVANADTFDGGRLPVTAKQEPKTEDADEDAAEAKGDQDQDAEGEDDDHPNTEKKEGEEQDDEEEEDEEEEEESAIQQEQDSEEDAEADEQEDEDVAGEKSAVSEDEDEEVERSIALGNEEEDEEEEGGEEEEEQEEQEGDDADDDDDDDDDNDDAGAGVQAEEEGGEGDNDEAEDSEKSSDEEEEEEEEQQQRRQTIDPVNGEQDGIEKESADAEHDAKADAETTTPLVKEDLESVPRGHKRSASVISEASKAGSNRSGMGRKKRR